MEFRSALEELADRAGVTLKRSSPGRISAERSADILETALAFFRDRLAGAGGAAPRAYLDRRTLAAADWERFEIGWAPASWDELIGTLRKESFSDAQILEAGLSIQGDRGAYDRFRGRVMFAIRNDASRLVGFGGRLIDGEGAKYVNSPESALFNKRRNLYLLHTAKKAIRESGHALLVEGYLDAIRCHLEGFPQAVATLGTSLTEDQAALLKRFAKRVFICYDADGAGQEASIRGMYILQQQGLDVRVVRLPEGKDPDDLLLEADGKSILSDRIKQALPLPLYHVAIRRPQLHDPKSRKAAQDEIVEGIASLPLLDVAPYLPRIAGAFSVFQHELEGLLEMSRGAKGRTPDRVRDPEERGEKVNSEQGIALDSGVFNNERNTQLSLESILCSLIWFDEKGERARGMMEPQRVLSLLTDERVKGIVSALLCGESPQTLQSRWVSVGEQACPAILSCGNALFEQWPEEERQKDCFDNVLGQLERKQLQRRLELLNEKMMRNEATKEEMLECQNLQRKLKSRN